VHSTKQWQRTIATQIANNFASVINLARFGLSSVRFVADHVLGERAIEAISRQLSQRTSSSSRTRSLPQWIRSLPGGAPSLVCTTSTEASQRPVVVYFPSCSNRAFGPATTNGQAALQALQPMPLFERVRRITEKAGYQCVVPEATPSMCCGLAFESHGFPDMARHKANELLSVLHEHSRKYDQAPIVCDMSQCCQFLYKHQKEQAPLPTSPTKQRQAALHVIEPVQLVQQHLAPHLEFHQLPTTVALHVSCSSTRLGLAGATNQLASKCAKNVVSSEVPCCGMAGDRGLLYPELPDSSLKLLPDRLRNNRYNEPCTIGISSSRTCEMALSQYSGVTFTSIMDLVDAATTPRAASASSPPSATPASSSTAASS